MFNFMPMHIICILNKCNIYFQVRDFNIAKTEADISSYAGYVGKLTSIISIFLSLQQFL